MALFRGLSRLVSNTNRVLTGARPAAAGACAQWNRSFAEAAVADATGAGSEVADAEKFGKVTQVIFFGGGGGQRRHSLQQK